MPGYLLLLSSLDALPLVTTSYLRRMIPLVIEMVTSITTDGALKRDRCDDAVLGNGTKGSMHERGLWTTTMASMRPHSSIVDFHHPKMLGFQLRSKLDVRFADNKASQQLLLAL